MNYKWFGLFVLGLLILFSGIAAPGKSSSLGDVFGFALLFAGIPYTLYKSFPSKAGMFIALASPLIIGPSFGYWGRFLVTRRLAKEGITTKAIVLAAWTEPTRHGGRTQLFRAKFEAASVSHITTSYVTKKLLQKGDTVAIRYAASDPEIYILTDE